MRGIFNGQGKKSEGKLETRRREIGEWLPVACAVAILVASAPGSSAQTRRRPQRSGEQAQIAPVSAPSKAATAIAIPDVAAPVVLPPRPLTPEEQPPTPPQVTWDGEQLSIISDNSRLSDILLSVRAATGAEIDVPPSASRERIAAHLGPGPAREVLSTLLSWTDFDYVVQASDNDPRGIQLVLLTARGKADGMLTSGSPSSPMSPARAANRRYRQGFAPAESAPQEDTTATQPESSADLTAAQPEATESAPAQPTPAETQPAPVEAPSDVRPLVTDIPATPTDGQSMQAELKPSPSNGLDSNQPSASSTQDRVQQMQNMFEQRRLLQEQARKGQPTR